MVSATAISLASGNLLLVIGVFGLSLGILAKFLVHKAEKDGKEVHKYWKYYGTKAIILGVVLIIFGFVNM